MNRKIISIAIVVVAILTLVMIVKNLLNQDCAPQNPTDADATPSGTLPVGGGDVTLTLDGGGGSKNFFLRFLRNPTIHWYKTDDCPIIQQNITSIGTGNNLTTHVTSTSTFCGRWEEQECGNSECECVTVNVTPSPTPPQVSAIVNGTWCCDPSTSISLTVTVTQTSQQQSCLSVTLQQNGSFPVIVVPDECRLGSWSQTYTLDICTYSQNHLNARNVDISVLLVPEPFEGVNDQELIQDINVCAN